MKTANLSYNEGGDPSEREVLGTMRGKGCYVYIELEFSFFLLDDHPSE